MDRRGATCLLSACAGMGGEGESRGPGINAPVTSTAGSPAMAPSKRKTDHGLGPGDAGPMRRRRRPAGRGLRRRQQAGLGRLLGQLQEPRRRLRLPRTRRAVRVDRGVRRRSPRRRRGLRRRQHAPGDGCSDECELEPGCICPTVGGRVRRRALRRRHHRRRTSSATTAHSPDVGRRLRRPLPARAGLRAATPGETCVRTVCNDGERRGQRAVRRRQRGRRRRLHPVLRARAGLQRRRVHVALRRRPDPAGRRRGVRRRQHVDGDGCSPELQDRGRATRASSSRASCRTLSVPVTYRDFICAAHDGQRRATRTSRSSRVADVTPGLVRAASSARTASPSTPASATRPRRAGCSGHTQQLTTKANFDQWYRDVADVNVTKVERMELQRDGGRRCLRDRRTRRSSRGTAMRAAWSGLGEEQLSDGAQLRLHERDSLLVRVLARSRRAADADVLRRRRRLGVHQPQARGRPRRPAPASACAASRSTRRPPTTSGSRSAASTRSRCSTPSATPRRRTSTSRCTASSAARAAACPTAATARSPATRSATTATTPAATGAARRLQARTALRRPDRPEGRRRNLRRRQPRRQRRLLHPVRAQRAGVKSIPACRRVGAGVRRRALRKRARRSGSASRDR